MRKKKKEATCGFRIVVLWGLQMGETNDEETFLSQCKDIKSTSENGVWRCVRLQRTFEKEG